MEVAGICVTVEGEMKDSREKFREADSNET